MAQHSPHLFVIADRTYTIPDLTLDEAAAYLDTLDGLERGVERAASRHYHARWLHTGAAGITRLVLYPAETGVPVLSILGPRLRQLDELVEVQR